MPRKEFFDKFASKLDSMDPHSIHSYVNLLSREHGFMESVFNAIREGILYRVKTEEAVEVVRITELVRKQNPKFRLPRFSHMGK